MRVWNKRQCNSRVTRHASRVLVQAGKIAFAHDAKSHTKKPAEGYDQSIDIIDSSMNIDIDQLILESIAVIRVMGMPSMGGSGGRGVFVFVGLFFLIISDQMHMRTQKQSITC